MTWVLSNVCATAASSTTTIEDDGRANSLNFAPVIFWQPSAKNGRARCARGIGSNRAVLSPGSADSKAQKRRSSRGNMTHRSEPVTTDHAIGSSATSSRVFIALGTPRPFRFVTRSRRVSSVTASHIHQATLEMACRRPQQSSSFRQSSILLLRFDILLIIVRPPNVVGVGLRFYTPGVNIFLSSF